MASAQEGRRASSTKIKSVSLRRRPPRGADRGRAPPDPYVAPARIVALALGPDDGVLCYGRVVVLRGRAVPWVKALVERWVVRLWPLPYALFRRLPALA